MPTTRDVHLHIEELVLYGIAAHDRERIALAIQAELSRLLGPSERSAAPLVAGHRERVDAGPVRLPPRATPEVLGARVARAVFTGLPR